MELEVRGTDEEHGAPRFLQTARQRAVLPVACRMQECVKADSLDLPDTAETPVLDRPIGTDDVAPAIEYAHDLRERIDGALPFLLRPGDGTLDCSAL